MQPNGTFHKRSARFPSFQGTPSVQSVGQGRDVAESPDIVKHSAALNCVASKPVFVGHKYVILSCTPQYHQVFSTGGTWFNANPNIIRLYNKYQTTSGLIATSPYLGEES